MTTFSSAATGPAITLTIDPTAEIVSILRSDANGNNLVRVPAGTFPRSTPVTVVDWEPSLRGPSTYTVSFNGAGPMTSTSTASAVLPWLVTPLRPSQSQALEAVGNYAAGRGTLSTVHQVPDRTDPLVALGRLASRTGTLAIWCADHAAAIARENILDMAGLAMLKVPDHGGMDMYFIVDGTDKEENEDGKSWTLSVAYTETGCPSSPINPDVWTFGTLAASFASFASVTSSYEDFEGLNINDQMGINL